MEGNIRFDKWSPLIPKVGEIVQVQIEKIIFETPVVSRGISPDRKTFYISIRDPQQEAIVDMLITPTANGIAIDPMVKPYWQIYKDGKYEAVNLFF